MEKIISFENLHCFAYSNDHICKTPICGIVMNFGPMGSTKMLHEDTEEGEFYAEKGILFLQPYYNPWSCCNRQALEYIEEILDVVMAHYQFPTTIPLVYTGNSMGGMTALACTVLCKYKAVACVANCPLCDLPAIMNARSDFPRVLYSAFGTYEESLEDAMRTVSPLHLVDKMPDIPYYIFACEADKVLNIKKHSDRFVEKMKKSHRVTYYKIPEMGHCKLPDDVKKIYMQYAADAILRESSVM